MQPVDGVYGATFRKSTVYLHILDCEKMEGLSIPDVPGGIISCTTFDGEPCEFTQTENLTRISLPAGLKPQPDTILKLTLDREIEKPVYQQIYFTGKE